jgi:hypothetical protein
MLVLMRPGQADTAGLTARGLVQIRSTVGQLFHTGNNPPEHRASTLDGYHHADRFVHGTSAIFKPDLIALVACRETAISANEAEVVFKNAGCNVTTRGIRRSDSDIRRLEIFQDLFDIGLGSAQHVLCILPSEWMGAVVNMCIPSIVRAAQEDGSTHYAQLILEPPNGGAVVMHTDGSLPTAVRNSRLNFDRVIVPSIPPGTN